MKWDLEEQNVKILQLLDKIYCNKDKLELNFIYITITMVQTLLLLTNILIVKQKSHVEVEQGTMVIMLTLCTRERGFESRSSCFHWIIMKCCVGKTEFTVYMIWDSYIREVYSPYFDHFSVSTGSIGMVNPTYTPSYVMYTRHLHILYFSVHCFCFIQLLVVLLFRLSWSCGIRDNTLFTSYLVASDSLMSLFI